MTRTRDAVALRRLVTLFFWLPERGATAEWTEKRLETTF